MLFINVDKMETIDGPSKIMLESQGVKQCLLIPIVSSSGIIYGILGFDYIHNILNINNVHFCDICRLSKQIAMLWENDEHLKTDAMKYKIGDYKIIGKK
jgi:hypothetical protein